jgi:hypothetical protein
MGWDDRRALEPILKDGEKRARSELLFIHTVYDESPDRLQDWNGEIDLVMQPVVNVFNAGDGALANGLQVGWVSCSNCSVLFKHGVMNETGRGGVEKCFT